MSRDDLDKTFHKTTDETIDFERLLAGCKQLAMAAGDAIMEIYATDDFGVEIKSDDIHSPLTKADRAAHEVIDRGLRELAGYGVLSEEGDHAAQNFDELGRTFWLVDPLDGTKEFIRRNGEFTVNIALIHDAAPVLGVVYVPATQELYYATPAGAYKRTQAGQPEKLSAHFNGTLPVIATTRSHKGQRDQDFATNLGEHEVVYKGSSIKFCLVAEGKASVYPRFVPCMLWDSAAADAIVRAAGGTVNDLDGNPLTYDPTRSLENPFFIASGADKTYVL